MGLLLPVALGVALAAGPGAASAQGKEVAGVTAAGIELVRIPGGEFLMGSGAGPADERPEHRVRLGAFLLGRFEVTQAQWAAVMGGQPAHFAGCPRCPVEQVSWEDVQRFLARAGRPGDPPLRLPTEAEWEYAAGGGAGHRRWPGTDDVDDLVTSAWTKGSFEGRTHPVGMKGANAFGLHDMAGNVAEWCSDWYGKGYYAVSPAEDPRGPVSGVRRVVRGGSFLGESEDARTARRSATRPDARRRSIGFRVARDVTGPDAAP